MDPLDVGYVLARLGNDPCDPVACKADVNCDGVIDPLDMGYVLARFDTCDRATDCVQDFCE